VLWIVTGYAWDGASGPTIDTRSVIRASLVHDALYQLMRLGVLDRGWRATADADLARIMIEDGAWRIRAAAWRVAVSALAEGATRGSREPPVLIAP
jgi:hypothetical protein